MRIDKYSLSWKWIIGYFLLLSVLGGLLILTDYAVKDSAQIWAGQCTVVSWRRGWSGGPIWMQLSYDKGNKLAETQDIDVIVSYLSNPGPLNCKVFRTGNAICDCRPSKGSPKAEKD